MDFTIDLSPLQEASANPLLFVWTFFSIGGWILVLILFVVGGTISFYHAWLSNQQRRYLSHHRHVLLAIDIPKGNEQTPKAVENVFVHLHGLHKNAPMIEKLRGYVIPEVSLEIIGIEGQIQFLIRCTDDARDYVESTIYAQYPDAAITEVQDYTDFVPPNFEDQGLDLWGCEFKLYNKEIYPIRTYPFFEHSLSQQYLDPLASLLELLSRLGPTEQVWIQLVISPIDDRWTKAAGHEVNKIIGTKTEHKKPLGGIPSQVTSGLYEAVTATVIPPGKKEERPKVERQPSYTYLSPGEQTKVQGIQMKLAKLGYETKFRYLYLASTEVMNKTKGVNGVVGAIKQFNTQDQNGFKPESTTKTTIDYFFKKRRLYARKHRLLENYRRRVLHKKFQVKNPVTRAGLKPFILNTEELASIFHFPVETVKAPMVQKTEAKRGEPPLMLPVEPIGELPPAAHGTEPAQHAEPPTNLPI